MFPPALHCTYAYSQGLYPDRTTDRRRHHRHSCRDRDPEVREHQDEGLHGGDEVGSSQPRHGEESFFADSAKYTVYDTTKLKFKPSSGVGSPTIVPGAGFWYATVTHTQIPAPFQCAIGVNTTNLLVTTAGDGEPACK